MLSAGITKTNSRCDAWQHHLLRSLYQLRGVYKREIDAHDVGGDDRLVVLAARDLAQVQQVPDDGDQEPAAGQQPNTSIGQLEYTRCSVFVGSAVCYSMQSLRVQTRSAPVFLLLRHAAADAADGPAQCVERAPREILAIHLQHKSWKTSEPDHKELLYEQQASQRQSV